MPDVYYSTEWNWIGHNFKNFKPKVKFLINMDIIIMEDCQREGYGSPNMGVELLEKARGRDSSSMITKVYRL